MPFQLRVVLTILPLLLLAQVYAGWKIYHSVTLLFNWPKEQVRWVLFGGLAFLNLHPLLFFLVHSVGLENLSRSIREGNRLWDFIFSYPFWIGLILVAEVLPFFLLIDFVKLPFYPFYAKLRSQWLYVQAHVVITLFAVFMLYVIVKVVIDTNRIKVSQVIFSDYDLPASLNGVKIAHISDVQADPHTRTRKLKRYITRVNKLKPDLVIFTGDLVTYGPKFIDMGANALGLLEAPYGVYACLGDHDTWSDIGRIKNQLLENDVIVLENANQFIEIGRDSLLATFLTNTYSNRPNLDKLNYLMGKQPRGALDIFVSHQPSQDLIEMAADNGYHLFLAGHTHGGQLVFKPLGFTLALPQFESPFFRGKQYVENMLVNINNGLGFTLVPLRYRAPAEISLIKLVRVPR